MGGNYVSQVFFFRFALFFVYFFSFFFLCRYVSFSIAFSFVYFLILLGVRLSPDFRRPGMPPLFEYATPSAVS